MRGRVVASDEVREANAAANQVVPAVVDVDIDGANDQYNPENRGRITGDFSGTTDEILQWGACKWGFHVDLVRARAVIESYWRQSTTGDLTDDPEMCARIGMDAPCHESYGLMQVRGTVHEDTFPLSRDSTSFNVDYSLAWLRACYEGAFPWLGPDYVAGDDIGCAGAWFSGRWYDASAVRYIDDLVAFRDAAIWETAEFDRADG